jgi:hypothetical protein
MAWGGARGKRVVTQHRIDGRDGTNASIVVDKAGRKSYEPGETRRVPAMKLLHSPLATHHLSLVTALNPGTNRPRQRYIPVCTLRKG